MASKYTSHLARRGLPSGIIDTISLYLTNATSGQLATQTIELSGGWQKSESVDGAIVALAEEFPETHQALIALVTQMHTLSRQDSDEYTELLRDAHDSLLGDTSNYLCMVGPRIPDDPLVRRWVNLSEFLASCEAAAVPCLGWQYAIYSISLALEAQGGSHKTIGKMDVFGSASAHWLTKVSPALYQASHDGRETGIWGMGKYSLERWVGWRRRLDSLSERADLGKDTRELLKRAALSMDKSEKL